jgi:ATP-dependent helicase/nuclease subunit A
MASTSSHGEQAVANLLKVGRLAEMWSEQVPMTLKDFVHRFDRYRDDERDEGENPLADVKYDAVKVLTIHKAKGLEFPVVILPNLSAGKRGGLGGKKLIQRDWRTGLVGVRLEGGGQTNAAMVAIELEEERRERAEEVRVFYVAATRAKSQLLCFVSGSEKEAGRFAGILKSAGPLVNVEMEEVQQQPISEVTSVKSALKLGTAWNVEALATRFKARQAATDAIQGARLLVSPTSLLAEPEKKRLIDDDEAFLSRENAIRIGHVCHKVMEEWNFNSPAAQHKSLLKKSIERSAKLFELSPLDPSSEVVMAEAGLILTSFVASAVYKKLSQVKIIGRELPFLYPLAQGAMRGVIDLLYEFEGKLIVADYKTNKLDDNSPAKLVDHYRTQGAAYQEAVRQSLGREAGFELIFLRDSSVVPV